MGGRTGEGGPEGRAGGTSLRRQVGNGEKGYSRQRHPCQQRQGVRKGEEMSFGCLEPGAGSEADGSQAEKGLV